MSCEIVTCQGCDGVFPAEFFYPFIHNGTPHRYCPACALKQRNLIHGLPSETPFVGGMAKANYDNFMDWKENQG